MSTFPEGFRWGAATAAHQIEGGCWNNDWWQWEHAPGSGVREPSGDACDSWNRWRDDVDLVADLGLNTYRFSSNGAASSPSRAGGRRRRSTTTAGSARPLARGVEPMITFHHFTTPRWVAAEGGWAEDRTAERFALFCERAAAALAPVMRRGLHPERAQHRGHWVAIYGRFPPGERSVERRRHVNTVFPGPPSRRRGHPHRRAGLPVGLTLAMTDYQALPAARPTGTGSGEACRTSSWRSPKATTSSASRPTAGPGSAPTARSAPSPGGPVIETMGYERWPDALEATLRTAWELTGGAVPLIVTESGIATEDDEDRIRYVHNARRGAPVP